MNLKINNMKRLYFKQMKRQYIKLMLLLIQAAGMITWIVLGILILAHWRDNPDLSFMRVLIFHHAKVVTILVILGINVVIAVADAIWLSTKKDQNFG